MSGARRWLCLLVVSFVVTVTLGAPSTIPVEALPPSVGRGTVFFALNARDLEGDNFTVALKDAATTLPGLTYVALQWIWTMPQFNSSFVEAKPSKSPNVSAIARFVRAAHALNLSVLLKPVVAPAGTGLMMKVNPADPVAWFQSYTSLLLPVARMAATLNVWCLSVGLELQHLVATEPGTRFQGLIRQVRAIAPNVKLTYCANPGTFEYLFVPFWVDLDYVGMDPYWSLASTANPTPTVHEMEVFFMGNLNIVLDWWRGILVPLNNNTFNGTKAAPGLLISEFGYPSSNMGLVKPYLLPEESQGGCTGPYEANFTAQAAAFATAFNGFGAAARAGFDLVGVTQFWWGMPGTDDYYPDRNDSDSRWPCGWTPVGKNRSIDVMQRAYAN